MAQWLYSFVVSKTLERLSKNYRAALNFASIALALAFLVGILLPLILRRIDMWDGLIFSYGVETKDFSGIEYLYSQYRMPIGIVFFWTVGNLSWILGTPFVLILNLLNVTIMLALTREVIFYARTFFGFSLFFSSISGLFFCVFPVWHVLHTSPLTLYLILIYLGLYSLRKILSTLTPLRYLWFLPLLVSFQLSSLVVFVPILSFVISAKNYSSGKSFHRSKKRPLALFGSQEMSFLISLIAITYGLVLRLYFPQVGFYRNYHRILSISEWHLSFAKAYLLWIVLPVLPMLGICVFAVLRKKSLSAFAASMLDQVRNFGYLILLCLAASIIYMASGKTPFFSDFHDWGHRHGMLYSVPASWLIAFTYQEMMKSAQMSSRDLKVKTAVSLGIIGSLLLLLVGHINKIGQEIYFAKLIQVLKPFSQQIENNSVVKVITPNYNDVIPLYEANYLIAEVTNSLSHWAIFGPYSKVVGNPSADVPHYIDFFNSPDSYHLSSLSYEKTKRCNIWFEISGPPMNRTIDKLRYVLDPSIFNLEINGFAKEFCGS